MPLALTLVAAAAALCFGVLHSSLRARIRTSARSINGPDTLEELFAARYARGDIDHAQYRQSVDRLSTQLHC